MLEDPFSEVEEGVIAFFGDMCHALSFPRSYGQIYGFAFVSRRPVSFEDVVEQLHLSKGSASQGIRWLRSMGAISPAKLEKANPERKSRREYFAPNTDFSALMRIIFRERLENPLQEGGNRLAHLSSALGALENGDNPRGAASKLGHLRIRLQELKRWHQRTQMLAPRLLHEAD